MYDAGLRHPRRLERVPKSAGAVVLGVSPDSEESHAKFRQKYGLPFTLLADPDDELTEQYGFWVEKNNYGEEVHGGRAARRS